MTTTNSKKVWPINQSTPASAERVNVKEGSPNKNTMLYKVYLFAELSVSKF